MMTTFSAMTFAPPPVFTLHGSLIGQAPASSRSRPFAPLAPGGEGSQARAREKKSRALSYSPPGARFSECDDERSNETPDALQGASHVERAQEPGPGRRPGRPGGADGFRPAAGRVARRRPAPAGPRPGRATGARPRGCEAGRLNAIALNAGAQRRAGRREPPGT